MYKLLAILLLSLPAFGASVSLSCTPGDATATSFHFYKSKVSGGPYAQLDIPPNVYTTCAFVDTAVVPGDTWYYTVAAQNAVGISLMSDEAVAVITGKPAKPGKPVVKVTLP